MTERSFRHSRDEVRAAKSALAARLGSARGVTSVGIGVTEARDDYAVTVTVEDEAAAAGVPDQEDGVPVRVSISGSFTAR